LTAIKQSLALSPVRHSGGRWLPFTTDTVAAFAHSHLSVRCEVASDGLWCFEAVKSVETKHLRTVTGGGVQSVSLPQFKAVNTVLSNLKTASAGLTMRLTSGSIGIAIWQRRNIGSTAGLMCRSSCSACSELLR